MKEHTAKKIQKPNPLFRLIALLITAALVLGALLLVVYRDRLNLDALERWLSYRTLETSDTGEAAPFTPCRRGARLLRLPGQRYSDGLHRRSPVLFLLRPDIRRGGAGHGEPGALRLRPGRGGL